MLLGSRGGRFRVALLAISEDNQVGLSFVYLAVAFENPGRAGFCQPFVI